MGLTKRQALEIGQEQWDFLAETGKYKHEWPGWEKYGEMEAHCSLCQYVSEQAGEDEEEDRSCELCPLYGKWGKEPRCYDSPSPFVRWCDAKFPHTRQKYAKQIADLFKRELKEMGDD